MIKKENLAVFFYCMSLIIVMYAWIYYPITQKHVGDFLNRLRTDAPIDKIVTYWNGEGMDLYGPIFTFMDYLIERFDLDRLLVLRVLYGIYLPMNLVSVFLLLRMFQLWDAAPLKRALGIFLVVNFFPLIQLLRQVVIENIQFFMLTLFLLVFVFHRKKTNTIAGILLGAGICAKTLLIALIPYLLARRAAKVAVTALVFFLVVTWGVSALKQISLLEGLKGIFLFDLQNIGTAFHENQALSGFVWRLLSDIRYDNLTSLTRPKLASEWSPLYPWVYYSLTLGVVLWTGLKTIPLFRKTWRLWNQQLICFEISILLSLLLLVIPHTQMYYFALILPAYLLLFNTFSWKEGHWVKKVFLLVSYFLIGFRLPLRILGIVFPSPFACPYIQLTNVWNFPFYGLCILLGLLVVSYRQLCYRILKKQ